jgi:hypothetical protein
MPTLADPISATAVGTKLEALMSAATLPLPAAKRAEDATDARREASDTCGVPVRIVPFAKAPARVAARFAATIKPAAASVTAAPLDAALTAAAVTPAGSATYDVADAVAVEFTDAENSACIRIVTVINPSVFVEMIGITVTLEGATPPVAIVIASNADEATSLCRAATTPGSFAFAGRANDRVSVIGTLIVSVKLMTTAASARVGKPLRDGDGAPEEGNDDEERLSLAGEEPGGDEAP